MPETENGHTKDISDGYHTFGELYEWRYVLFSAVIKLDDQHGWWTRNHHPDNDPMFEIEGQSGILVGLELPTGSVQFHMPARFIPVIAPYATEYPHGPYYDGTNNPETAMTRMKEYLGI